MLFRAFDVMLPSMLTAAYRLHGAVLTESLGRMTPGDDYHRLVPLLNAIPAWLHAMLVSAGACYLVTALCLLVVARHRYYCWPALPLSSLRRCCRSPFWRPRA